MELEEKRKDKGMLWQQTKESILEARGIISSNNSITGNDNTNFNYDFNYDFNYLNLLTERQNFIPGELLRERLKHQAAGVKITNGDYTRVPLNDHNQTF